MTPPQAEPARDIPHLADKSDLPRQASGGLDNARLAHCVARIVEEGSREAFAELFGVFAPRVKSYLLRLGAEPALAEEIAQEVMLTVWRKAEQYDPAQASVSTWIFRIARNRRIDAHRRAASRPEPDENDAELFPAEIETPHAALDRIETEGRVRAALATLPEEQRQMLQAAFYEGLSQTEIAERFNLPLGTVKSRTRLAFGRLRNTLSGED